MNKYTINCSWDDETHIWYAANDEIPIILGSGFLDALMERVKFAVPDMLEINGLSHTDVSINFVCTKHVELTRGYNYEK